MLRTLVAVILAFLSTLSFAASEPESVPQRLAKARAAAEDIEVRVAAIESLATITQEEENAHKVVDALVDLLKTSSDLFIRIEAIETLAAIQANTVHEARAKYFDPVVAILKGKDEHLNARIAAADLFRKTMDKARITDMDQVFKPIIVPIAVSKTEPADLRVVCIATIGDFGKAEHVATVADLLNETDATIRGASVSAILTLLQKVPDAQVAPGVINKLLEVLRDDKAPVVLRSATMKLMAQLAREGNLTAKSDALPVINTIAVKGNDDTLVLAAVEALGMVGSSDCVDPLKKVYTNYYDAVKPDNARDIPLRKAVMKAMRTVLARQNDARMEAAAVKAATAALVDVIDNDTNAEVKTSAVFALRYLYPKKFEAEHKDACGALITLLGATKDVTLQKKINDTLQFITGARPGTDHDKWMDYFLTRWPKVADNHRQR